MLVTTALWAACSSAPVPPPGFGPAESPDGVGRRNLLVVLLDDVGIDRIGSYGVHPEPARTPTLDRLAAQGTRFHNAYAYATCSPTRAALLTGRYSRRTGTGFNVRFDADKGLAHQETLIPEMLAQAVPPWSVAGIGKWHLTPFQGQRIDDPHAQGFRYYAGAMGNLLEPQSYTDYTWYADDGTVQAHQAQYLTTREVDEAVAQVQRLPEPWFVYLALHAPHAPFEAPPAGLLTHPLGPDASVADRYDAMLEAADREIGRLLGHVDLSDTVLMVLGDNGTPREAVRSPQLPTQAKNSFWEGGLRVPWFVAGPGIPAGRRVDALVSVVDIFPTVAAMAGLEPQRAEAPIDGRSLWPLLLEGAAAGHEAIFLERHNPKHRKSSWLVLRDRDFKLVRDGLSEPVLYDMRGPGVEGTRLSTERREGIPEARAAFARLKARVEELEEELSRDPLVRRR